MEYKMTAASPILMAILLMGSSVQADPLDPKFQPIIDTNSVDYPSNVWVTDSMVKVHQDSGSPGSVKWALPYAAKNEFESFQVHEQAGGSPIVVNNVVVSDLVNAQTGTHIPASTTMVVYREAYLNITALSDANGSLGYTPDILIPAIDPYHHQTTNAFPFTIAPGQNQSFWIDVLVPASAPSGYYQGTVTVTNNGSAYATLPVVLAVWNFALPSTASLRSSYAISWGGACQQYYGGYVPCGQDAGVQRTQFEQAVMLLDHRLTGADLAYPGPSNNVWTSFNAEYSSLLNGTPSTPPTMIAGASLTSIATEDVGSNYAYLQDWVTNFKTNDWLSKLFTTSVDEPSSPSNWATVLNAATSIHATTPPATGLVTTNLALATANNALNAIDIMACPIVDMEPQGGSNQRLTYNNWLQTPGHSLWMYQACPSHGSCANGYEGPASATYPSVMVDATSVRNRLEPWIDYLDNVVGDLYYETVYCWSNACGNGVGGGGTNGGDPWNGIYAFGGNGDGTLMYPGTTAHIGVATPIPLPSIRLKLIRDGMEDYEYMHALAGLGQSAFVAQTVGAFITNAYTFSNNSADLQTARLALGNKLHALSQLPPVAWPPLTLNWPSYASLNTPLQVNYGNVPVAQVVWDFVPTGSSSANQTQGTFDSKVLGAVSFPTASGAMTPVQNGLTPGTFQGTVQLKDINGNVQATAGPQTITFVNTNLSGVQVYPNPWRSDKHAGKSITFADLTLGTTIKLFTVSGHEIKELHTDGPETSWDLTNDSGNKVGSGIYIYLSTDNQGNKVRGKLAIIK